MLLNFIKSIKGKLIGIIVIALVIALGISSILIYCNARSALTDYAEQSVLLLAESSSKETGLWLEEKKSYITALANMPLIQDRGNQERVLTYFAAEIGRLKQYETLFITNEKGDYHSCTRDNNGNLMKRTGSIKDRAYFPEVMQGKTIISDPVFSKDTANPVVVVAVPIKKDGRIIGVMGGTISVNELIERVSLIKMGKTGYAYVVQGDGLTIIHPDKNLAMKYNLLKENDSDLNLRKAFEQMVQGKAGYARYTWNGADKYMGYAPVPGVYWAMAITVPVAEVTEQLSTMAKISLVTPILIAIVLTIVTSLVLTRMIIRPLGDLQAVMARVEAGDFTMRGRVRSEDEIGALTGAVNKTLDVLSGMIKDIHTAVVNLNDSSANLIDIATNVAANSQEMSAKICSVSSTVQQISANIEETASSTEEVSLGVDSVANLTGQMSGAAVSAAQTAESVTAEVNQVSIVIEEISDSISRVATSAGDVSTAMDHVAQAVKNINQSLNNISRNCERSIDITTEAEERSRETTDIIQKLNSTSKQINKIVDVIRSIAEQTNMLALNATIEAAGAGEAGKGFAVVAAEVKELAKRTAEETRHIAQQIEDMQSDMAEAVTAVGKIAGVIAETTDITRTVASDVSEQSQSVNDISSAMSSGVDQVAAISKEISDIAGNAEQVSKGATEAANGVKAMFNSTIAISDKSVGVAQSTEEMASMISTIAMAAKEIAQGTQDIIKSIQEADAATADTAGKASQTSESAYYLGEMANRLNVLVEKFKV